MKTTLELDRYTPEQLNRLHDAARASAPRLRREALDLLWSGVIDTLSAQRVAARRAAVRFARSLRRHAVLRAATPTRNEAR